MLCYSHIVLSKLDIRKILSFQKLSSKSIFAWVHDRILLKGSATTPTSHIVQSALIASLWCLYRRLVLPCKYHLSKRSESHAGEDMAQHKTMLILTIGGRCKQKVDRSLPENSWSLLKKKLSCYGPCMFCAKSNIARQSTLNMAVAVNLQNLKK